MKIFQGEDTLGKDTTPTSEADSLNQTLGSTCLMPLSEIDSVLDGKYHFPHHFIIN